jgi:hypothetical protein
MPPTPPKKARGKYVWIPDSPTPDNDDDRAETVDETDNETGNGDNDNDNGDQMDDESLGHRLTHSKATIREERYCHSQPLIYIWITYPTCW